MEERKWTREQEQFLIENYETMKTDELVYNLKNKTNDQIRWKAKTYNLKKKVTKSKKDITWLEDLRLPETCYWWGFLTADGCFTEKQLILSVSVKDKEHIRRFANLSKCNIIDVDRINNWNPNGYIMSRIVLNDKISLPRIRDRFSIIDKKTYNPFNIEEFLTYNKLIWFVVGLIDGDGYIDPINKNIRIKIHQNWIDNLDLISNNLKSFYDIKSSARINKDGWAILSITTQGSKIIKDMLAITPIPYMDRKWNRISHHSD